MKRPFHKGEKDKDNEFAVSGVQCEQYSNCVPTSVHYCAVRLLTLLLST